MEQKETETGMTSQVTSKATVIPYVLQLWATLSYDFGIKTTESACVACNRLKISVM